VGKKNRDNQPTNIAIAICTATPIDAQVQAYIHTIQSYKHNQAMLCYAITSTASGPNHVDRVALERGRVVGVGDDLHGRVLVAEQRLPPSPRTAGRGWP